MPGNVALVMAALLMGGCASAGFMNDRKSDAADIFTASAGAGIGVKARVGPVGTGILIDAPLAGLRGGDWLTGANYANPGKPVPVNNDIQLLLIGEEEFVGSRGVRGRGKTFAAVMVCGLNVPLPKDLRKEARMMDLELGQRSSSHMRYSPWPYLTQIETVLGIGVSLRLGFNPGEVLDFLAGWFGADLFDDDLCRDAAASGVR